MLHWFRTTPSLLVHRRLSRFRISEFSIFPFFFLLFRSIRYRVSNEQLRYTDAKLGKFRKFTVSVFPWDEENVGKDFPITTVVDFNDLITDLERSDWSRDEGRWRIRVRSFPSKNMHENLDKFLSTSWSFIAKLYSRERNHFGGQLAILGAIPLKQKWREEIQKMCKVNVDCNQSFITLRETLNERSRCIDSSSLKKKIVTDVCNWPINWNY